MKVSTSVPEQARGLSWLMREEPASLLLSIIAGFVDTAGFIALGGVFTAHVTGNLVLAGAAIVQGGDQGVLSRLILIPVFMVAVTLATLLARFAKGRRPGVVPVLLCSQVLAMTLFLIVAVALTPRQHFTFDQSAIIIIGSCGVLAMGIQNTLMREGLSTLLATTVMTGNLTQFTIDLVNLIRGALRVDRRDAQELRGTARKVRRYAYVLAGFVIGAAGGAFGIATWHFWCLLVPLLITIILAAAALVQSIEASTENTQRSALSR